MKSEQVHLILIISIMMGIGYWVGFKAGTNYGSNKELSKIVMSYK